MKKYILLFSILLCLFSVVGQNFSVAADKNNILYAGIDNPLTITVENLPSKSIIVRADSGNITGRNGNYVFHTDKPGPLAIILFRKTNGKLMENSKK